MKIRHLPTFWDEAAHYALRFTCEDCALYEAERDRCAHEYPTGEHRAHRYRDRGVSIVFCKEYELV